MGLRRVELCFYLRNKLAVICIISTKVVNMLDMCYFSYIRVLLVRLL